MTPDRFKDLLDRYSRGECSETERKIVDEWYNNLQASQPVVPHGLEEKLWKKINPVPDSETSRRRSSVYLKIAASLALIVISFWIYTRLPETPAVQAAYSDKTPSTLVPLEMKNEIRNDSGVPRKVTLEDGSIISLQPQSSLTLPERFTESERVVSLTGEAFFDIKRDSLRPFFVYSREVVTKVLGTSFNIKARESDKEITVAVKTGRVSVFTNPKLNQNTPAVAEVILTPNQQAVYDRKEVVVTKEIVEKPEVILAKPTLFMMKHDETPVSEIFKVLEENYGVDILYNDDLFKNCFLTTKMSDEGLFERIQVICKAIGATYSIDNAVIRIEGNGCQ